MTLVELLVVIVLITVLVATAIPVISPGGDDRKLREASRNLNAYLQGAQARAQESGRPFGVAFRRLSAATNRGEDNAVCSVVEYVEVPPWYTGQSDASRARVCTNNLKQLALQLVNYGSTTPKATDRLPDGFDVELIPGRFLRPGDEVSVGGHLFLLLPALTANDRFDGLRVAQVDSSGYYLPSTDPLYGGERIVFRVQPASAVAVVVDNNTVTYASADQVTRITHDADGNEVSPASPGDRMFCSEPAPYRVNRQPVPAGGEALELPSGVAVDLQASVFGTGARVYSPHLDYNQATSSFTPRTTDVMLLFSPQGGIDRVHGVVDTTSDQASPPTLPPSTVTGYLALCVGRRELIPAKPQGTVSRASYAEPIDLYRDVKQKQLSEEEARELTDQYNWLNPESRWVLVAGTTGGVSTVESRPVFTEGLTGPFPLAQQLAGALDAVPRRVRAGGR